MGKPFTAEVLLETVSEFRGTPPDLPVSETILSELREVAGDKPLFVTLPIGKVDVTSRNGRKYPRSAIESLVNAVNQQKPGGIKGHLRDDERPYRFDVPSVIWLSAKLESDGTAWAKGFVLQSAADVHEYVRVAKTINARIATSIYGMGEMDADGTVTSLQIESIDLVHPQRAGVPNAVSVPLVTSEAESIANMLKSGIEALVKQGMSREDVLKKLMMAADMTADEMSEIITGKKTPTPAQVEKMQAALKQPVGDDSSEMKKKKGRKMADETVQTESEQIAELNKAHKEQVRDLTAKLAENGEKLADYQSMYEMLGKPDDVILTLRQQMAMLENLKRENGLLLEETIKAQVAEKVKLEAIRPVVVTMVKQKNPVRRADVTTALEETLKRDDVVEMLKAQVLDESGPPQKRPSPDTNKDDALILIPGY